MKKTPTKPKFEERSRQSLPRAAYFQNGQEAGPRCCSPTLSWSMRLPISNNKETFSNYHQTIGMAYQAFICFFCSISIINDIN
jgi:hypothetical protein